jgi:hypothetical protein
MEDEQKQSKLKKNGGSVQYTQESYFDHTSFCHLNCKPKNVHLIFLPYFCLKYFLLKMWTKILHVKCLSLIDPNQSQNVLKNFS